MWYEKLRARIGLRLAGLALLLTDWRGWGLLCRLVRAHPAAEATVGQCLLAALLFLGASVGAALLVMGADLWKPVTISARWSDPAG